MLTLSGQLLDVVTGSNTNKQTGVISQTHTAEILHKSRGKSVVDSLKVGDAVLTSWRSAIGKNISVEVRTYSMKTSEGGIMSGLTLAFPAELPTLLDAPSASKK